MNHSPFIGFLAMVFLTMLGCSDHQATDTEAPFDEANWNMPFRDIAFDPSLTTEEWLNVIISDSMNAELDLENYVEIFQEDAPTKIVFVASGEDGLGIYQLIGDRNFEYTMSEVGNFSEIQLKRHDQIAGINIYRMHEDDVNGDGSKELIVSADISGTAHNDEGMYPYRMIQHEILVQVANGYEVNKELTVDFNEDLGIDLNGFPNRSSLERLSQKYYRSIANIPDNEVQAVMQGVLEEMDITTYGPEDLDKEFSTVVKKDDSFVVHMSWLASGYYFIADQDNEFAIERNSSWNYPILYISDREVETWQIFDMVMNPDTAFFVFRNVEEGSSEMVNGHFTQDVEGRWLFNFNGDLFMMGKDTKALEVVGRELDQ